MKNIITVDEKEVINLKKIYNFTKSKIWEELKYASVIEKEKPFYINIPASKIYDNDIREDILVQGIIDLYYINKENELVLVDYKTDYVQKTEELVEKYKVQLDIYKKALEEALQRKVEKVYLDNTNLMAALAENSPNIGNVRETFFFNQMRVRNNITGSPTSDFMINNYTFEVGGRNKKSKQI